MMYNLLFSLFFVGASLVGTLHAQYGDQNEINAFEKEGVAHINAQEAAVQNMDNFWKNSSTLENKHWPAGYYKRNMEQIEHLYRESKKSYQQISQEISGGRITPKAIEGIIWYIELRRAHNAQDNEGVLDARKRRDTPVAAPSPAPALAPVQK